MPFELKKQKALFAHLNSRIEKHGDQNVRANDIKIIADVPNTFLNQVAPDLIQALYKPDEKQGELQLADGHLPVLRYEDMGPLVFFTGMTGATFIIHGHKKADDIEFTDAKIKKIMLDCKEGGTVEITFKAQVHPQDLQAGKLALLHGDEVKISVFGGEVSASVEEQREAEKQKGEEQELEI